MLYDASNPNSHFWDFMKYGRGGRVLTAQQEARLGRRGNGGGDGSFGGGGE